MGRLFDRRKKALDDLQCTKQGTRSGAIYTEFFRDNSYVPNLDDDFVLISNTTSVSADIAINGN